MTAARSGDRFVAGGDSGWWESAEGADAMQRIETKVRSRYRARLEGAGWLRRVLLERRVRREIAAERAKVLWTQEQPVHRHGR